MIYLATRGRLAAFDLATEQKIWEQTYDGACCERPEVTPDGKTLVVGSDLKDFWYVINAQDGALKGKIQAPKSNFAHNMGLSADGKTVFMAPNGVTMTVGDVASMKALKTITFSDHIRPFVINHDATRRVAANVNNLLRFRNRRCENWRGGQAHRSAGRIVESEVGRCDPALLRTRLSQPWHCSNAG